jgi:hypothetical protein
LKRASNENDYERERGTWQLEVFDEKVTADRLFVRFAEYVFGEAIAN